MGLFVFSLPIPSLSLFEMEGGEGRNEAVRCAVLLFWPCWQHPEPGDE